jgi:hypothetical protein
VTSYDGGGEERSNSTRSAAEEPAGRITAELLSFRTGEGDREVRSRVGVEVLSDDCVLLVSRKWQAGTSRRLHESGIGFGIWICLFLLVPVETIGLLDALIITSR